MRTITSARRLVATATAVALVSTGGWVVAAQPAAAAVPVSISPPGSPNEGVRTFTVDGSFYPQGQQLITITRQGAVVGQGEVAAEEQPNFTSCSRGATPTGLGVPDDACSRIVFTADLNNVAPGTYDVVIEKYQTVNPLIPQETYTGAIGVASNGSPNATGSNRFAGAAATPDGKVQINGTFLSKGSVVQLLLPDKQTVDPGLTFTPGVDGGAPESGYVSSTILRGTLGLSGFTSGAHYVRVTNAVGQTTTSDAPFFVQPRISAITPNTFGQGATKIPTTLTGDGFEPASTLFVNDDAATVASTAVTASDVSTGSDGRSITTALSVTPGATVGAANAARDITVRTPSGGFFKVVDGIVVTASPKPTAVAPTNRGQGFIGDVTVNGSAGLNAGTAFDFGQGITAVTKSATSGTSAIVNLTIAPDATLGARSIKATNSDNGTTTLANGFTVNAKPLITSVTPASALRGEAKTVDFFGAGFVNGVTLTSAPAGLNISALTFVSASQLRATVQPSANLPTEVSAFDLTVTNPDGGTSTRPQGFGVNSVSVLTTPVTNALTSNVVLQAANLDGSSVVTLSLPSATDQQPLRVPVTNVDATNKRITVSAPLTKYAAGLYTVTATDAAGSTLVCVSCLNVLPGYDPNGLTLTPATGGQGAVGRVVTVSSSNEEPAKSGLSRGQTISLGAGITVRSTTYDPATDTLTGVLDIANNATAGTRDLLVTNTGQPGSKGAKAAAFTVTAAPVTTAIAPTPVGQGASLEVTLTGTGYQEGAVVTFSGDGLTFTPTSLTPTEIKGMLDVAPEASTTTARSVTVTNPDGGTLTPTDVKLSIVPKPVITSLSPAGGKRGGTLTGVVFTGTGFDPETSGEGEAATSNMSIVIGDVTVSNLAVQSPTQLTADLAISATAVLGSRAVFIGNTANGGRSNLPGGFTVSDVPVAPTVSVTPGSSSATVTWTFPDTAGSDGGSPVTSYVVDDGDAATDNAQTVPVDSPRSATFTGLTPAKALTFTVKAVNAVGTGPAGTATGTPYGVPLAPTTVNAQAGAGSITVSFSGADAQGDPITEYTARVASGGNFLEKTGTASPITFTGLFNGTTYDVSVKAKNAAGYGAYSTQGVTATPTAGSTLTSTAPRTAVANQVLTFSGRLLTSDGTPRSGATVVVRLVPEIGNLRVVRVGTTSNGTWSFRSALSYNTSVETRFDGDAVSGATTAATYRVSVATQLVLTSPRSGSTSKATTTVKVVGKSSPNKAGRLIFLIEGSKVIARATIQANGTYTFSVKPARGTHRVQSYLRTSSGNAAGVSGAIILRRT